MIGVARGKVKICPYTVEWKEEYEKEEKLLLNLIGPYAMDIQHVGSTSIEGLASKPIIDIALGVKSLDDVEAFKDKLEKMGYSCRSAAGVEGRILFAKGSEDLRTHYLHIEIINDDLWKNHIYFRDYLRTHSNVIKEYSNLKHDLFIKYPEDRYSYTAAKNEFISAVLKKAREIYDVK